MNRSLPGIANVGAPRSKQPNFEIVWKSTCTLPVMPKQGEVNLQTRAWVKAWMVANRIEEEVENLIMEICCPECRLYFYRYLRFAWIMLGDNVTDRVFTDNLDYAVQLQAGARCPQCKVPRASQRIIIKTPSPRRMSMNTIRLDSPRKILTE